MKKSQKPQNLHDLVRDWELVNSGMFGSVFLSPPAGNPEGQRTAAKLVKQISARDKDDLLRLHPVERHADIMQKFYDRQNEQLNKTGQFLKDQGHHRFVPQVHEVYADGYTMEQLADASEETLLNNRWWSDLHYAVSEHHDFLSELRRFNQMTHTIADRVATAPQAEKHELLERHVDILVRHVSNMACRRVEFHHQTEMPRLAAAMELQQIAADWPGIARHPDGRAAFKLADQTLACAASPEKLEHAAYLADLTRFTVENGYAIDGRYGNVGVRPQSGELVWYDPVFTDADITPAPRLGEEAIRESITASPKAPGPVPEHAL